MGFADVKPHRLVRITFSIANLDEVAFIGVLSFALIGLPIQVDFKNTAWTSQIADIYFRVFSIFLAIICKYICFIKNFTSSIEILMN